MRIFLAGGGTGGHLCPGFALAEAFGRLRPGAEVVFVGTRHGLDWKMVPAAGYPLRLLAIGRGSPFSPRRPLNAPRLLWSMVQCRRLFRREPPAAVVALGGHAAAVPGWTAHRSRVPLFVLESNAVPGRVNARLAAWAHTVHLLFPEAREGFGRAGKSVEFRVDGVPLRPEFRTLAAEAVEAAANGRDDPRAGGDSLLVLGGSQGARRLNELVVGAAAAFHARTGARIIHVTGESHAGDVREAYGREASGAAVEILPFAEDVAGLMRRSRVLAARAGAGTISEAAAAGLPTLLLPLSTSRDDHQRRNAEAAARRGGAEWLDETTARPEDVAEKLIGLWSDGERRRAMSRSWRTFMPFDAADRLARHVLAVVETI